MCKYSLGIDFGSLSARAVLVNVSNGSPVSEYICEYTHGIIEGSWLGKKLPDELFLQIPQDYIQALSACVSGVIKNSHTDPRNIICMGVDSTSATIIPCQEDGAPLCSRPEFTDSPFAQALMWKSHSTQKEVEDILSSAERNHEVFMEYSGKTIPSNTGIPKLLHLVRNAPDVYEATSRYYDLCDWIVRLLTDVDSMNTASAGGKFLWTPETGWPSNDFFADLDERMRYIARDKLPGKVLRINQSAGTVTEAGAKLTGLAAGTPVVTGLPDGISPLAAAGISSAEKLMLVIGTSASGFVLNKNRASVKGLYGMLSNSPYEDYYTYETGLQSFGDTLAWFLENCCPSSIKECCQSSGEVFDLLSRKAELLTPGESGLLAMNWWNGNRSILVDGSLTGVIMGMTLATRPEEIYRALVEGMAFNFRMIKDEFHKNGIFVKETIAVGGIPMKNPFIMQLIADIMGGRILVPRSVHMPALGSAIFATWAVGSERDGYNTIEESVEHMSVKDYDEYFPNLQNTEKYEGLYQLYVEMCEYLGENVESPIKKLHALKTVGQ